MRCGIILLCTHVPYRYPLSSLIQPYRDLIRANNKLITRPRLRREAEGQTWPLGCKPEVISPCLISHVSCLMPHASCLMSHAWGLVPRASSRIGPVSVPTSPKAESDSTKARNTNKENGRAPSPLLPFSPDPRALWCSCSPSASLGFHMSQSSMHRPHHLTWIVIVGRGG